MLTADILLSTDKDHLADLLPTIDAADIAQLVEWLAEKDDDLRYKTFMLLQARSQQAGDVYPYWDALVEKLGSDNSYQRSLGLMLLAENVRWDVAGRFEGIVERYLSFVDDEKPITVRQCVQSLCKIVPFKPVCHAQMVSKLTAIDLMQRKDTQRKILLLDILGVLAEIRKVGPDERIDRYVSQALLGGILDAKAKKVVAGMFGKKH